MAQAPVVTFAEAMQQARMPLVLQSGTLSGEGGEMLKHEIAASRFVLIGESHGSREIPQFTAAVCKAMRPDVYVSEAAPSAAELTTSLLGKPDRVQQVQARVRKFPGSMAFLDMRDESDLADYCASVSQNRYFQVWGLDQEFLGSAGYLLSAMANSAPGPRTLAAIRAAQASEMTAEAEAAKTGDYLKLYLVTMPDSDAKALTDAVDADGTAEARRLLRELLQSHRIYRLAVDRNGETNHVRSLLMKEHFVAHYVALHKTTADARLLFKFGQMHVGKGFSGTHQIDIGDMVAQLADAQGVKSLHIMIFGAHGTQAVVQGYRKPLKVEPFNIAKDKQEDWAAAAVAAMLPGADTITLFDLRKLRYRKIDMPAQWQTMIYSYDLFVLLPQVSVDSMIE